MYEDVKAKFLRENDWYFQYGKWNHPFLAKQLDLESAYLYEKFKHHDDSVLFDDDQGV